MIHVVNIPVPEYFIAKIAYSITNIGRYFPMKFFVDNLFLKNSNFKEIRKKITKIKKLKLCK
jgi:hypothetical protein